MSDQPGVSKSRMRCVRDARGKSNCLCDACSSEYFARDQVTRPTLVFSGRLFSLKLEKMRDGDFGQVDLGQNPMEITLNTNVAESRLQVSAAHEILHVLFELYKIEATHEQLHGCAVSLATEGVPALIALSKVVNAYRA